MIYLYDNAIVEDLIHSFNPTNVCNPVVRVIDPEGAISVAAQIQNDEITYPIVVLSRSDDVPIDASLWNFTRAHKGVPVCFDNETNLFYNERAVPIDLNYSIVVITTNIADRDELVRELLFKYSDMYYLTITIPYESKRKLRFGCIAAIDEIQYSSKTIDYIQSGKLYQTIIPLHCQGCVLVSNSTHKLRTSDKLGVDID